MGVKHKFVSNITDIGDSTIVRPSNWNDDHIINPAAVAGALLVVGSDGTSIATTTSSMQPADPDLDAIANLTGTGLIVRTGAGAVVTRAVVGTTNEIAVSGGDAVSANPVISLATPDRAFDTIAALQAATVPLGVNIVRISRYSTSTPYCPASWRRITTPGTPQAWQKQSGDGAWWQLAEPVWVPQMLGAVADGSANDHAQFSNTIIGANTIGARVLLTGSYYSTTGWTFTDIARDGLIIEGIGVTRSTVRTDNPSGDVLVFNNTSNANASFGLRLRDFALYGANAAQRGLVLNEAKQFEVRGIQISGCKSHGIEIGAVGIDCVPCLIESCQIGAVGSPNAGAAAIKLTSGNSILLSHNYMPGAWPYGLNSTATSVTCIGQNYEGNVVGCRTGGDAFVCVGAYFNVVSGFHYQITQNSDTTIIGPRSTALADIDLATFSVNPKWVHLLGLNQLGSPVPVVTAGAAGALLTSGGAFGAAGTWVSAWSSWTPALSGTGNGASVSTSSSVGLYVQLGKPVHFQARVVTNLVGSATGQLQTTLPVPADANQHIGHAINTTAGSSGYIRVGNFDNLHATIIRYDNVTWLADSTAVIFSGTYQAA